MGSEQQHAMTGSGANCPPAAGSTMQAIVQDAYGSAGVLRFARIAPLDQVPEAMRHLEAGKARGKVAITT